MFLKILNAIKNIGLSSLIILFLMLAGIFFAILVIQTPKQQLAFPSAQGDGAYASGGRGGAVYHVRTTKDSNDRGTLRYALNQKGPRTIVFDTSGLITLKEPLTISNGDVTIAGQTAPGDGICIKGPVTIDADNVIMRFIRIRLGGDGTALSIRSRRDIIIDHCSFSWAGTENINIHGNRRLTLQWSIISEPIANGYGSYLGGYSATYHHNLFANSRSGNPKFYKARLVNKINLDTIDFRNNVLYNWGTSSVEVSEDSNYNILKNYYKYGPATDIPARTQLISTPNAKKDGYIYIYGNYIYENPLQSNDNWMGVYPNTEYIKTSKNRALTKLEFEHEPVSTQNAENVYKKVVNYAGASLKKDDVDKRLAREILTERRNFFDGTAGYSKQIGNYPTYNTSKAEVDSDGDGIPDDWEFAHNLNPYDGGDGRMMTKSGYTNLETYLNSLADTVVKKQTSASIPNIDTVRLWAGAVANLIKK